MEVVSAATDCIFDSYEKEGGGNPERERRENQEKCVSISSGKRSMSLNKLGSGNDGGSKDMLMDFYAERASSFGQQTISRNPETQVQTLH